MCECVCVTQTLTAIPQADQGPAHLAVPTVVVFPSVAVLALWEGQADLSTSEGGGAGAPSSVLLEPRVSWHTVRAWDSNSPCLQPPRGSHAAAT